jgi:hypothetical protein
MALDWTRILVAVISAGLGAALGSAAGAVLDGGTGTEQPSRRQVVCAWIGALLGACFGVWWNYWR